MSLALPALEPVVTAIKEWAQARSIVVHEGLLEVGNALPEITVVGFDMNDIQLFFTLAAALDQPTLVLNPLTFDEEGMRLVNGLAQGLREPRDREYYKTAIASAKPHLGKIQEITVHAFPSGLARVVTFRAATDWGAPLLSLSQDLGEE
jgi:hypothetical protein